jgi:hypothetical protein
MLTHTQIFWSLPSPQEFCSAVTDAARVKRAIIVNRPKDRISDYGLREALHNANILDPLFIDIGDGTNISSTLAPHFGDVVTHASSLATEKSAHGHAVVLRANSERSQKHCEKYMTEFIEALPDHDGNIRLILSFEDSAIKQTTSKEDLAVIVYDGMLRPEEMQAYVSYRMLGREDFRSTTLIRHLVTEFASFDVGLAEDLIRMTNEEILNLPESLTHLVAAREEKWATQDWIRGSASLTCPHDNHTLCEWYQAIHTSPLSDKGRDAVKRRYWRACIKAISPWIEERRHLIIEELYPVLFQLEPSGDFQKKIGSEIIENVQIKDLEYGDLLYQKKRAKDRDIKLSRRQAKAFDICWKTKVVRDAIAHTRMPSLMSIQDLVLSMEDFCTS